MVDRHHLDRRAAHTEQAQGPCDGHVGELADEDAQPRRAAEPGEFDVPAPVGENAVTRSSEAGDVSHLAAGD